jgi:hypothetical protein
MQSYSTCMQSYSTCMHAMATKSHPQPQKTNATIAFASQKMQVQRNSHATSRATTPKIWGPYNTDLDFSQGLMTLAPGGTPMHLTINKSDTDHMAFFNKFANVLNATPINVPGTWLANNDYFYIRKYGIIDPRRPLRTPCFMKGDIMALAREYELDSTEVEKLRHNLNHGPVSIMLALHDFSPRWYRLIYNDAARRKVIDVNRSLALEINRPRVQLKLGYSSAWIMRYTVPAKAPRLLNRHSLKRDPVAAVVKATHPKALLFISKFHGYACAAGGHVASKVAVGMAPAADIDLFVATHDKDLADEILEYAHAVFGEPLMQTMNAVTWRMADGTIMQLIKMLFPSLNDVILTFDFPASMIMLACRADGTFHITATRSCMEAIRCRAFPVDITRFSPSTVPRVFKYECAKGKTYSAHQA